ncbi:MAG: MgtC/SapB family protein [Candidatus Krumholzibacteriia bacterium]
MDLIPDTGEIALRLALAIVLGGALGVEREIRGKVAGLKTHMMVALGSATFTLVALEIHAQLVIDDPSVTRVDPLRLLEGIIGGIGFLGAGSIIRSGGSVEGLTTAGSLWFTGAIGVSVGGGHYVIAGLAVGMGLVVLIGVRVLERRIRGLPDHPG